MLKKKAKGYVITLEIIFSLWMFVILTNSTVYLINAFNTQRYMNTVMTSVVSAAAKYGGTNSNLARLNNFGNMVANATNDLRQIAPKNNVRLTAGPSVISSGNKEVWVELKWDQDSPFSMLFPAQKDVTMRISVSSIAQPGDLL